MLVWTLEPLPYSCNIATLSVHCLYSLDVTDTNRSACIERQRDVIQMIYKVRNDWLLHQKAKDAELVAFCGGKYTWWCIHSGVKVG